MSEIGPVKAAERLDALDVLRGFALCGILLMNIPEMGQSWLTGVPLGPPSFANPSWVTWLYQKLFFEGSMRGLFTLLFGAGILFMTRRAADPGGPVEVADVFYRRCLGLIVLGLANVVVFIWPGDIVYIYGVCGLFLFIFRRCKPSTLLILAIVMVVAESAAFAALQGPRLGVLYKAEQVDAVLAKPGHPPITKAQQDDLKARAEQIKKAEPDAKALAEETKARQSGWPGVVKWSFDAWTEWAFSLFGVVGAIGESIGFMLLGMALFKWRVLTGERSWVFYVGLTAGGLAVSMALRGYSAWLTWTFYHHPVFANALYQTFVYEFARLPLSLFWLGAVVLAWKALPRIVFAPLRALGKMALTNYLGQSLITSVLFYGFHLYGRFNWAELWALAAAIWVVEAILSIIWLRYFEMGPAEWALRSATYRSWQPLGKARLAAPTIH